MAFRKKSRLGLLLELFFDAALLLIFMAQAFVVGCLVVYGYLPLPTGWGNQLIAQKLPPGIILEVDQFHLRAGGSLDLVGIDLRSPKIQQSLLVANAAEVRLSWNGFKQLPSLEGLVLSAGTLYIPSVYSADGYHSPILERIALRLVPGEANWNVDRFAALHDSIRLRGSFELPTQREDTSDGLNIEQKIHNFYTQVAKLSQQQEHISYFDKPTIAFKLTSPDTQTQQIDLRVSSRQFKHPEASARDVQLEGIVQLKEGEIIPVSAPRLTAQNLEFLRIGLKTEGLSAEFPRDEFSGLLTGQWPSLKLAAESMTLKNFKLDAPILRVDSKSYPQLTFNGATGSLNGAIDLSGQANAETMSGHVRARGSVDLVELAPENLAAKLPNIAYDAPPYYDLSLNFGKDFSLNRADLKAQVNNLQINDLTVDHITAQASYQDGVYEIEDLYLRRQKQWLDLKFSLDSTTSDYRVTLIGSAVPYEYNALLPSWWGAIFRDFDFSQTDYSLGDFIIYGNTQRKSSDLYYGHAEASQVSYKGVKLDYGELIVRGRGPYCELHDLKARSGEGWARGNIAFASKTDEIKGPASIRLDMEAKLTLDDAAKLFSGNVSNIIADFETEGLPVTKLKGAIFNDQYPEYAGKSYFDLSAVCAEPVSFKGIPLDHLSFDLYGRSEITYLRNVSLGYAEGQGTAQIDVLTPPEAASSIRYQFSLLDADQNQAVLSLPQLNQLESSLETKDTTSSETDDHETARVDIQLHGEGPVQDHLQHAGFGHFEIRNDKLGTIQLLGPLSKILQNTQFNFTSFNLNQMHGDFRYKKDIVHFDPLRIDGTLTQINAPGTLRLSDQSLDMRVLVSLFGNAGNPDSNLRKIGDLITRPIPNLLEFELTGTLKDQKLRSLYDPRNLIPKF